MGSPDASNDRPLDCDGFYSKAILTAQVEVSWHLIKGLYVQAFFFVSGFQGMLVRGYRTSRFLESCKCLGALGLSRLADSPMRGESRLCSVWYLCMRIS